jgi:hypothetical protein
MSGNRVRNMILQFVSSAEHSLVHQLSRLIKSMVSFKTDKIFSRLVGSGSAFNTSSDEFLVKNYEDLAWLKFKIYSKCHFLRERPIPTDVPAICFRESCKRPNCGMKIQKTIKFY